ncbi:unnamed protein product, partial [Staurois parvus]
MTRDCGHSTGDDQRLRTQYRSTGREDCTALDQGTGKDLLQRRAERLARYSDT